MKIPLTAHERYTTAVICFINLSVYIDRFTVLTMSDNLSANYDMEKSFGDMLNVTFLTSYTMVAPIFGYLGDRYSRRKLIITSVLLWSIFAFVSAIAPTSTFLLYTRSGVGVCQAGFCVISPCVLADIVRGAALSKLLSYFYMTIPVGVGIGYLLNGIFSHRVGMWWWCVFLVSLMTFAGAILLFFGLYPKRGFKDSLEFGEGKRLEATSYNDDILSLMQNKSFLLISLALASIFLVSGAITFYGAELLVLGYELIQIEQELTTVLPAIEVKFGAITLLTGLIGVPIGSKLSRLFRSEIPCIDTIICGWAVLISTPIMAIAILTSSIRAWETFYYIFFAELVLNTIWAVSADMLLYIVTPTRRCSAIGWNIFISHCFGDILSQAVVERIRYYYYRSDFTELLEIYDIPDLDIKKFYSLRITFHVVICIQIVGGVIFLCNAFKIVKFMDKAKKETHLLAEQTELPKVNA